jgi:hypothetical protein
MLGETVPVHRRGVEVAQAARVHRVERGVQRRVGVARRGASERQHAAAEPRDRDVSAREAPPVGRIERHRAG